MAHNHSFLQIYPHTQARSNARAMKADSAGAVYNRHRHRPARDQGSLRPALNTGSHQTPDPLSRKQYLPSRSAPGSKTAREQRRRQHRQAEPELQAFLTTRGREGRAACLHVHQDKRSSPGRSRATGPSRIFPQHILSATPPRTAYFDNL